MPNYDLNWQGLTVMLVSVCSVVALVSFCFYRVMRLPPVDMEEIKGPLEIDTRDTDNAD